MQERMSPYSKQSIAHLLEQVAQNDVVATNELLNWLHYARIGPLFFETLTNYLHGQPALDLTHNPPGLIFLHLIAQLNDSTNAGGLYSPLTRQVLNRFEAGQLPPHVGIESLMQMVYLTKLGNQFSKPGMPRWLLNPYLGWQYAGEPQGKKASAQTEAPVRTAMKAFFARQQVEIGSVGHIDLACPSSNEALDALLKAYTNSNYPVGHLLFVRLRPGAISSFSSWGVLERSFWKGRFVTVKDYGIPPESMKIGPGMRMDGLWRPYIILNNYRGKRKIEPLYKGEVDVFPEYSALGQFLKEVTAENVVAKQKKNAKRLANLYQTTCFGPKDIPFADEKAASIREHGYERCDSALILTHIHHSIDRPTSVKGAVQNPLQRLVSKASCYTLLGEPTPEQLEEVQDELAVIITQEGNEHFIYYPTECYHIVLSPPTEAQLLQVKQHQLVLWELTDSVCWLHTAAKDGTYYRIGGYYNPQRDKEILTEIYARAIKVEGNALQEGRIIADSKDSAAMRLLAQARLHDIPRIRLGSYKKQQISAAWCAALGETKQEADRLFQSVPHQIYKPHTLEQVQTLLIELGSELSIARTDPYARYERARTYLKNINPEEYTLFDAMRDLDQVIAELQLPQALMERIKLHEKAAKSYHTNNQEAESIQELREMVEKSRLLIRQRRMQLQEDFKYLVPGFMPTTSEEEWRHNAYTTSLALADFSTWVIKALQSLTKEQWQTQAGYNENLFKKVQSVRRQNNQYKQVTFTPEEVEFLQLLLNSQNQKALSAQLVHTFYEDVALFKHLEVLYAEYQALPFADGDIHVRYGFWLAHVELTKDLRSMRDKVTCVKKEEEPISHVYFTHKELAGYITQLREYTVALPLDQQKILLELVRTDEILPPWLRAEWAVVIAGCATGAKEGDSPLVTELLEWLLKSSTTIETKFIYLEALLQAPVVSHLHAEQLDLFHTLIERLMFEAQQMELDKENPSSVSFEMGLQVLERFAIDCPALAIVFFELAEIYYNRLTYEGEKTKAEVLEAVFPYYQRAHAILREPQYGAVRELSFVKPYLKRHLERMVKASHTTDTLAPSQQIFLNKAIDSLVESQTDANDFTEWRIKAAGLIEVAIKDIAFEDWTAKAKAVEQLVTTIYWDSSLLAQDRFSLLRALFLEGGFYLTFDAMIIFVDFAHELLNQAKSEEDIQRIFILLLSVPDISPLKPFAQELLSQWHYSAQQINQAHSVNTYVLSKDVAKKKEIENHCQQFLATANASEHAILQAYRHQPEQTKEGLRKPLLIVRILLQIYQSICQGLTLLSGLVGRSPTKKPACKTSVSDIPPGVFQAPCAIFSPPSQSTIEKSDMGSSVVVPRIEVTR